MSSSSADTGGTVPNKFLHFMEELVFPKNRSVCVWGGGGSFESGSPGILILLHIFPSCSRMNLIHEIYIFLS